MAQPKYMKDVEFEEDQDLATLAIPKRPEKPPESVIAQELVKRKVVPSGRHANYVLIGLSIVCFIAALMFFALYVQTPKIEPKSLNPVSQGTIQK